MIDQNRDGFIDSEDLKDMLASLGKLLLWELCYFTGSAGCYCFYTGHYEKGVIMLMIVFTLLFLSGQEPTDSVVDGMMSEAPGPLNFTMFLTLFGEKLTGKRQGSLY